MSKATIPTEGIVILTRSGCQPCITLKNIIKNLNKKAIMIDVESIGMSRMSVPQLYYNGQYKFTGIPSVPEIIRSIK